MARKQKFTRDQITEALTKAHGLKTGAAELLACDWTTIDAYCKRFPEAQAVIDHWRKRRKDRAEYRLDEAIERGESWAIMFTLKNAHDREYNERYEVRITESDIDSAIERELARLSGKRKAGDAGATEADTDGE